MAFKHFKYYFPDLELPQVYSIISEFSYNAVTLDTSIIAISLDLYLGKEFKYYYSFDFPNYMIRRFEKPYMVPNCMEVLYQAYFDESQWAATDALIYAMIEKGKKLYFLECMQPEKEKHYLIGYTPEQLEWMRSNESEVWKFYNSKDLFFTKDYMEHKRHIQDGPMTAGMPAEAPGNAGSWVGWQIVDAYMNGDGKAGGLAGLMQTDPQIILNKSKYKPK